MRGKGHQDISIEANKRLKTQPVWREVKHNHSYAQVVKVSRNNSSNSDQHWKGISFETEEANVKWLEGSYIGRLNNCMKVQTVMEEIVQGGLGRLRVKYLGDSTILIQGMNGT